RGYPRKARNIDRRVVRMIDGLTDVHFIKSFQLRRNKPIDGVIAIDKFPETQLYDPGLGTSLRNHPLKDGWYDDYEPQVRPRVEMMQGAVQFQQRMSIQVIQAVQNDHLAVLLIDDLADVDIILPFVFSRFEKMGRLPVHVLNSGIEGLGFRINRNGMID